MGMREVTEVFSRERDRGSRALIAFLMAGDPSPGESVALAAAAVAGGADMVEVGWPFSDPIADGPTIQAAGQRALASGTTPDDVLEVASQIRKETGVPVLLLTYLNPLVNLSDVARLGEAGVGAVVVPDLSLEESGPWRERLSRQGISLVPFAAPTSPPRRLQEIGRVAGTEHFVYCVAVKGVTGARRALSEDAIRLLTEARSHIRAPLALGFGISSREAVREASPYADGVIVGSALVQAAADGGRSAVRDLARGLKAAAGGG